MGFNIEKFNNDSVGYDIQGNLGKLTYLGIEKQFIIEDGKRTDKERATHIVVYSDKLGESLQLKLRDELNFEELPFMSEVEIVGQASPWIYDFPNKSTRGNETFEFRDYGFSLRIDGYKKAGGQSQPKPQKGEGNKEHQG